MLPRSHGCKAIQSGQVRRLTVSCAELMRDMFQNNILFGAPYNEGRYRQGSNTTTPSRLQPVTFSYLQSSISVDSDVTSTSLKLAI